MVNIESDGSVVVCASTDNCPLKVPEKNGIIRGVAHITGFVISPKPGDPSKSVCTMINEVDMRGSLPEFASRLV